MKRLAQWVFCLAISLIVCGCGTAEHDQLVGTWVIDQEAMKETEAYKNASDAERQMMDSMGSSLKWEMTFTQGTVKMDIGMSAQDALEHPYTVKSVEGDRLVLTTQGENGNEADMTVQLDGERLIFTSDDGQNLTLRRK